MRDIPLPLQDFTDRYENRYRDVQLPLPMVGIMLTNAQTTVFRELGLASKKKKTSILNLIDSGFIERGCRLVRLTGLGFEALLANERKSSGPFERYRQRQNASSYPPGK